MYKAKINLQAIDGSTALHIATRKGHEEIVKALIDANVDTTLKNSKEQIALNVAIDKGLHIGLLCWLTLSQMALELVHY